MRSLHERLGALEQAAYYSREPYHEGARLVLTGEAAAAVSVWWEAHGSTPTGNEPCAVLHVDAEQDGL